MQPKYELVEKEACCSSSHSMCLGSITCRTLQPRVVSNTAAEYSLTAAVSEPLLLWENAVVERPNHLGLPCRITEAHRERGTTVRSLSCQYRDMKWGTGSHAQWLRPPFLVSPYLIYGFNTSFNWLFKYPECFHIICATTKKEIMGNADLSAH